ncbi:MAG TPA: DUF4956 domain-containing protein [Bacteroidia bacterium]|jgi:hypothetical protein|nr:DUF4956 domain-containing protein [Bacteroidia bacterium]
MHTDLFLSILTDDSGFFDSFSGRLGTLFFARLGIDLLTVFLLIRLIYFRIYRNGEFLFTFLVFNLIIFLITYLLNKVDMSLGAAFGLFAVFSMLRYRTEGISAREMTYLFVVISIGLISAVSSCSIMELGLLNGVILGFIYVLEAGHVLRRESQQQVVYENINLIQPEQRELLIADLKKRTGLNIHRVTIGDIDFLKDTALIKIYYYE